LETFPGPSAGGGFAGRQSCARARLSHAFAQRQQSTDRQEKIVRGPLMFADAAAGPPCFYVVLILHASILRAEPTRDH
jgi:hypothetical protein